MIAADANATAAADFARRHGMPQLEPVVVLIASYLEADNIGDVLRRIPGRVCGLGVSTVVVVDGGDDGTEGIVSEGGAYCARLPVNMGQGVALRAGYAIAREHGARFVVTCDADGQNDPGEIEDLLSPLLSGEADFVIASRRLGTDETTDRVRRLGVRFFAWVINALTGLTLTDTSNGFRAIRADVLADVRLTQDQYQTAELVIAAARRGWRITERPATWHKRASGRSKKGHNLTFALNYARVVATTAWRERRKTGSGPLLAR